MPARQSALHTLIRQSHQAPSCGGHRPNAERQWPGKDLHRELDPRPGIREQPGPPTDKPSPRLAPQDYSPLQPQERTTVGGSQAIGAVCQKETKVPSPAAGRCGRKITMRLLGRRNGVACCGRPQSEHSRSHGFCSASYFQIQVRSWSWVVSSSSRARRSRADASYRAQLTRALCSGSAA
jgi:hypothetical protein